MEDALRCYQKSAELNPQSAWTYIELSGLYRSYGDLMAAFDAAQNAISFATDARDRAVAMDEFGDQLVAQGYLGKALESFQASHVMRG